jgi:hypothetical protein
MKTLILNSANILPNTNNSNLVYRFPTSLILEKGQKLALTSFSMYYSTFNITSVYNNNVLQYIWFDGITYTITIPDGFYDIPSLNNYIHSVMISNKHYCLQTSNNYYVYFLTITTNSTYYAVSLNTFGLNQTLATNKGWTVPPGANWVIPTTATQYIYPMFNILANSFQDIIGLSAGYYPLGTAQATITTNNLNSWLQPSTANAPYGTTSTVSFLSTFTPQVSPVASYTITCNLINNKYSIPNSLLYSFGIPPTATFGTYFTIQPPQMSFIDILEGNYNEFVVQILDQNQRPVVIQDPTIVILLNISDPAEHGIMK